MDPWGRVYEMTDRKDVKKDHALQMLCHRSSIVLFFNLREHSTLLSQPSQDDQLMLASASHVVLSAKTIYQRTEKSKQEHNQAGRFSKCSLNVSILQMLG